MLFNSYIFLFGFLPITLILFWTTLRFSNVKLALGILIPASLFFYAWWNPPYVLFLCSSILGNFLCGHYIAHKKKWRKEALIASIAANLLAIGYFKYAGFMFDNTNALFSTSHQIGDIFLPLGISFFTFQQITYLFDVYSGKIKSASFLHYALFVSFFPQLIAGPIVHAKEIIPQFKNHPKFKNISTNMAIGSGIFCMGLFKKTFIADSLSGSANFIFDRAESAEQIEFFAGWMGALAYTFQLYFDFSGYSDMAIGLALMFGLTLPINFLSPYKATNIADFWRRWHITMSRFFRDYIYIPLGGNRSSPARQLVNLGMTMFLAGLWHGAGWTFVFWGLLHGAYLAIHRIFTHIKQKAFPDTALSFFYKLTAYFLTFIAVVIGWVFFRADSFEIAFKILKGMGGFNGIALPDKLASLLPLTTEGWIHIESGSVHWINDASYWGIPLIIMSYFICMLLPASVEYFGIVKPPEEKKGIKFNMSARHAALIALFFALSIFSMQRISEFLYFQF